MPYSILHQKVYCDNTAESDHYLMVLCSEQKSHTADYIECSRPMHFCPKLNDIYHIKHHTKQPTEQGKSQREDRKL